MREKNSVFFSNLLFLIFSLNAFFTVLSTLNEEASFFLLVADTGQVVIKVLIFFTGLFFISNNIKEYTKKNFFVFIILTLFFIVYQFIFGNYINYVFLLFILFFTKDNSKVIYQSTIFGIISALILVFLLTNLGIIENNIGGYRSNGLARYSMGFYGLMIFGRFWRVIAMCHTLSTDNIKISHTLLVILGSFFAYYQTRTRSEFILVFIIYSSYYFFRKTNNKYINIIFLIGTCLLIFLPIASMIIGNYYNSSHILKSLNQLSTGRLFYSANLWNTLPVKFFGNHEFEFFNGRDRGSIGYVYNFVDNGWDQMILIQGLVPTFLLIVVIFILLRKLKKERKAYSLFLVLIMIILFAVSQSVMFSMVMNPLILEFGLFLKKEAVDCT